MASKIYFAAPLFDDMELRRNLEECKKLEEAGYTVFLPQRDAGEAAEGVDRNQLFKSDVKHVLSCDVLIAYIDGRVPDEGTVFEIGMAYTLNKVIILVRTDRRSFMEGHLNVMLEGAGHIVSSTKEAIKYMEDMKNE